MSHFKYLKMRRSVLASALVLGFLASCSGSGDDDASNRSGSTTDDPDEDIIFIMDGEDGEDGLGMPGSTVIDGCVAETTRAETIPYDLYVMFDQSGSMVASEGDGTRLDAVRAAFADFLRAPASTGLGVGIGYFGNFPLGQTSCDPEDYREPSVELGTLPGNADALLASLNAIEPTGETPTGAAIRGACQYATQSKSRTRHTTAILLVTDGVPEAPLTSQGGGCNPTLDDAIAATEQCVASSGISVYVLGVGPNLSNLQAIAEAGETGSAHIVDGGDVHARVLEALNAIRGQSLLPCELQVPDPPEGEEAIDYDKVNVVLTDAAGEAVAIPYVGTRDECGSEPGWHYSADRELILLCPASCDRARAESVGGELSFALGCTQVVRIR
jgi:hypothetical protein